MEKSRVHLLILISVVVGILVGSAVIMHNENQSDGSEINRSSEAKVGQNETEQKEMQIVSEEMETLELNYNDNKINTGDSVQSRENQDDSTNNDEFKEPFVKPKLHTTTITGPLGDKSLDVNVPLDNAITGVVLGFDHSNGLSDVIIVVHYNRNTKEIRMIRIPRDTCIDFRMEPFYSIRDRIEEDNPDIELETMKVNALYTKLAWRNNGLNYYKEIISNLVGFRPDQLAKIDLDGFVEVVEAIGGVEFDVPLEMKYDDDYQDLHIDLQPGLQQLDGEQALGMIRFREGYTLGDIQRVKLQQELIIAIYHQVMVGMDSAKATNLAEVMFNNMKTDFGLNFIFSYIDELLVVDTNQLLNSDNMMIIPGYGEIIEHKDYLNWDADAVSNAINKLF